MFANSALLEDLDADTTGLVTELRVTHESDAVSRDLFTLHFMQPRVDDCRLHGGFLAQSVGLSACPNEGVAIYLLFNEGYSQVVTWRPCASLQRLWTLGIAVTPRTADTSSCT